MGKKKEMVLTPITEMDNTEIPKTTKFLKKTISVPSGKFPWGRRLLLQQRLKKYNDFYGTNFWISFKQTFLETETWWSIEKIEGGIETPGLFTKVKAKIKSLNDSIQGQETKKKPTVTQLYLFT